MKTFTYLHVVGEAVKAVRVRLRLVLVNRALRLLVLLELERHVRVADGGKGVSRRSRRGHPGVPEVVVRCRPVKLERERHEAVAVQRRGGGRGRLTLLVAVHGAVVAFVGLAALVVGEADLAALGTDVDVVVFEPEGEGRVGCGGLLRGRLLCGWGRRGYGRGRGWLGFEVGKV